MSIPYLTLYVSDYDADTAHLTLAEDGAYMRLLRLCWRTPGCSLPDDDAWIMRRMRCGQDEFCSVVQPVIDEFFKRMKGRIYSPRLSREFKKANEVSGKRSSAGRKGGLAGKALKTNDLDVSPAKAKKKPGSSILEPEPTLKKKTTNVVQKKTGSRLPEDWRLPDEGRRFAQTLGLTDSAIDFEAGKFRDYWISVSGSKATKLDWIATWRNWIRNNHQAQPKQASLDMGAFGRSREIQ